jgi:ribosomal protein S18 acetylase RimI-like enzyme
MNGITIRPARRGDLDDICRILYDEPPVEVMVVAVDAARARRVGRVLVRAGASVRLDRTTIAMLDGRPVGLVAIGERGDSLDPSASVIVRVLLQATPIVGIAGLRRYARLQSLRSRVESPHPPDSWYIAELDVDAAYRNRGIGGVLLTCTEERAREKGYRQMSLGTQTTNPAQHLYERHGFRIVATRTDPEYERLTGVPGRVLMVKDLQ